MNLTFSGIWDRKLFNSIMHLKCVALSKISLWCAVFLGYCYMHTDKPNEKFENIKTAYKEINLTKAELPLLIKV